MSTISAAIFFSILFVCCGISFDSERQCLVPIQRLNIPTHHSKLFHPTKKRNQTKNGTKQSFGSQKCLSKQKVLVSSFHFGIRMQWTLSSQKLNKWQLMLLYNTFEWAKKNREKRRPETQLKWTIPNKYKTLTTPHSILLYFEIPLNVSNNFKGTFVQRRKWINRMSREQKREKELALRSRRDVY